MITVGIDVGAGTAKAILWENGQRGRVLAKHIVISGRHKEKAAREVFAHVLEVAGLSPDQVKHIFATGVGAKRAIFAQGEVSVAAAAVRGIGHFYPSVRTVIDVGAEEGRATRLGPGGKVLDFAVNEKCAAGAGAFIEAMARALEIPVEEMGLRSLRSTKTIPMNAQCAVFSESEVVSLIHSQIAKEDIARAIHDAIAGRIASMVQTIGVEEDVALIGGMARNGGFIDSLMRQLKVKLLVPPDPEFVGALGAALAAAD